VAGFGRSATGKAISPVGGMCRGGRRLIDGERFGWFVGVIQVGFGGLFVARLVLDWVLGRFVLGWL